ncbi:MAG: type II toxin-antitoxin system RelE/ParE family toxin [Microscillaceae bacterium]|nr:type II toxin-antitoxin system RelE/ParE family toxin [Microscillaceae bacterium]
MVEVIITRTARQDLTDIGDYISQQSPERAQALIDKLLLRISVLEKHPEIGYPIPELNDPALRQLLESNYRILYQIASEKIIYILRFLHSKRQLEL